MNSFISQKQDMNLRWNKLMQETKEKEKREIKKNKEIDTKGSN